MPLGTPIKQELLLQKPAVSSSSLYSKRLTASSSPNNKNWQTFPDKIQQKLEKRTKRNLTPCSYTCYSHPMHFGEKDARERKNNPCETFNASEGLSFRGCKEATTTHRFAPHEKPKKVLGEQRLQPTSTMVSVCGCYLQMNEETNQSKSFVIRENSCSSCRPSYSRLPRTKPTSQSPFLPLQSARGADPAWVDITATRETRRYLTNIYFGVEGS